MGTKFIRSFKQEGFSLRVDAMKLLKRVLEQQSDEEIRKELISAILSDLKNHVKSDNTLCIVTKESLNETLANIQREQTRTDEEEIIRVENAFDFPSLYFNASRNTFEKVAPENFDMHAPADTKIFLMRERLEAVHRRLMRDPLFQVNQSFMNNSESIKLTTIEELVGSQGSQSVLGFLSKIDDEFLYLEDLSGYVKLKILRNCPNEDDNTFIMPSIYSEGMAVLVQGKMKGGIFEASLIGTPKVETRESFFSSFPSFEVKSKHEMPNSANVVMLSDVWLDRSSVIQKLRTLFEGYCKNNFLPELFVLMGNFHSVPLDSLGTNTSAYIEGFEKLADLIAEFPLLQDNSQILLVPGPTDPFDSGILPRRAIASHFTKSLDRFDNVSCTSNPCRISFYSQEIFIFRHDMLATIQRLSLIDGSYDTNELYDMYVQSILGQGHLSPVPLQVNPVYWKFDYTLRLDVLPDLLVLADSCEQFSVQHEGCCVVNPGSFTQEYSFVSHTPADGDVSFSIIGNSYTQVEDETIGDYDKYLDNDTLEDDESSLENSNEPSEQTEPENSDIQDELNVSDVSEDEKENHNDELSDDISEPQQMED